MGTTERLETGMTGVDVSVVPNAAAHFGGWKLFGLGRKGGAEGSTSTSRRTKDTRTPDPVD
jgi:succinate-semialdehyde dehydrogenase/glutarate-semialdehyde dehydrogenase